MIRSKAFPIVDKRPIEFIACLLDNVGEDGDDKVQLLTVINAVDIVTGRTSSQTSRALLVMVWRCPGGVHFKPNLTSYARDGLARSRRTHFPGEATSAIRESIICSRGPALTVALIDELRFGSRLQKSRC
ncbi:hypothetical protein DERF_008160 [Dermatophagoides farinae]|uniref:Uncharacterized protein n=1 Tax=Dermatophagoides farinae TaxID=6954 RepID=A0A922I2M2_DERFA|nr:hypothetical protein DERF_008160 [Dermatophagoides farinae]